MTTGIAAGKLLLFGEHSAVYGSSAVGLGVPWRLKVRFTKILKGDEGGAVAERLRDAYRRIAIPFHPSPEGSLEVRSAIPCGVGLGSSAALCVALSRAVGVQGHETTRLYRAAHRAEHAFHGSPSGVDTGLSILGGVQKFTRSESHEIPVAEQISVSDLFLVVGYVPREGDTAAHVAAVRRRINAGESIVRSAIDRLGKIAQDACILLEVNDFSRASKLGFLADDAHDLLTIIGVGSATVSELLEIARFAGATGGKISGGGGGGAFLAFVPDRETGLEVLNSIAKRLPLEGSAVGLLHVGMNEVTVVAESKWPDVVIRRISLLDDGPGPTLA